MSEQQEFQSVWLRFDDGTEAAFSGKAVAYPGDKRRIVEIKFTIPRLMPEGYSFEVLGGDKMVWEREDK